MEEEEKLSKTDSRLVTELTALIDLGEKFFQYYSIEMTDPIPEKYKYLGDLSPDEWDERDKKLNEEYCQLIEEVLDSRAELRKLGKLTTVYQKFYTKAHRVVAALAPERLDDFVSQYRRARGDLNSLVDYTIYDGLMGIGNKHRNYGPKSAVQKIRNQLDILISVRDSLGSVLFEIHQTLRMDLFDSEISAAKHLLDRGHVRAAGAVAGVVLEEHLKSVAQRHGFRTRKKAPGISDYNEFLKSQSVVDIVTWRRIQGLADIRNLCDHAKDRAPTEEDADDLILGTERMLKSVL
ncbi:MAG: hypothetical protein OXH79_02040 [Boseongicola sp.]|nr:hypothetical protein [Boseongicola sp.]